MSRTWWRVTAFIGLATLAKVFWDPVRLGSPRVREWPVGLRAVGVLSGFAYVLAALLVVASGWLRAHDRLVSLNGQVIPAWGVTLLLWPLVIAIALAFTAAMHTHPGIAVLTFALLGGSLLFGTASLTGPAQGVPVLAVIAIAGFSLARARYRFAWFEFPVVLVLVTVAIYVPLIFARFGAGADLRPGMLMLLISSLAILVAPALVMGGYSPAEVAVALSEWLVARIGAETAGSPRRSLVLTCAVALGLAVFGYDIVSGVTSGEWDWRPAAWPGSIASVLLALAVAYLMLRRRPGRKPSRPTPEEWNRFAYPLSAAWVGVVIPVILLAMAGALASLAGAHDIAGLASRLAADDRYTAAGRAVLVIAAVVLIVRARRRGERVAPVLLLCFALFTATQVLTVAAPGMPLTGTLPLQVVGGVGVALVLLVVALVRRRGAQRAAWIALLALTISAMVGRRDVLDEPGSLVAGVSGLAVLLLGLIWRVLTDAGITRRGSRWFPVPTRVLFFAANSLCAAVVVAHVALSRSESSAFDLEGLASIGGNFIGPPLIVGAILLGILSTLGLPVPPRARAATLLKAPAAHAGVPLPPPDESPDEKTVIRDPQF